MHSGKCVREFFILVLVIESSICDMKEPRCYSRFDYDEKILEKMVRTEIKNEELLGKLDVLEKRLTHVETEVYNTVKETQALEKKHDTAKEESAKSFQDLEKTCNSLQAELEKFEITTKSNFDGHQKSFQVHDQRLHALSRNKSESLHHVSVAFFATVSSSFTTTSSMQTLVFDNVVTDVGGGYNPGTGVFTAPVDGLYVFSTSVTVNLSTTINYGHFKISKNGRVVMQLLVQDINGYHKTVSGTATLSLQVGDTVNVTYFEIRRSIRGDYFSFFSGFIL